jgi:hypothetical protein
MIDEMPSDSRTTRWPSALGALHQLLALIEDLVLQDVLGVLLGEHGDAVLAHAAEREVHEAVGEGAVGLAEQAVDGRGEGDEAEPQGALAELLGVGGDVRRGGQHTAIEYDAFDAEECGGVARGHGCSNGARCGGPHCRAASCSPRSGRRTSREQWLAGRAARCTP